METIEVHNQVDKSRLSLQQLSVLKALSDFATINIEHDVFVLTGSAGTGKTSLLKEFVDQLESRKVDYKLLAPTGRAARVLSKKTGRAARTLHSFVYAINEIEKNDKIRYEFVPRINKLTRPCVLIVDEASMISDQPANSELFVSKQSVLQDFLNFYRNSPEGSKVVFVGDLFQLPPVNEDFSGALVEKYLNENHKVKTTGFTLTEIMRQAKDSYILNNAILIKDLITKRLQYLPKLRYKHMYRTELAISNFCKMYKPEDSGYAVFLGWKNATVDKLNRAIRKKLFDNPVELFCPNEQIIVGRSYYSKDLYFPSGDIGRVIDYDPNSYERVGEIRFADAVFEFQLPDGNTITLNRKFDIDFLLDPNNTDNPERMNKLWADRKRRNRTFRETNNPADDPYLSAIKVKYGYAITTHKAQGGEWDNVFLYPEFPKDEQRLRWIYTSVTRASKELYSF